MADPLSFQIDLQNAVEMMDDDGWVDGDFGEGGKRGRRRRRRERLKGRKKGRGRRGRERGRGRGREGKRQGKERENLMIFSRNKRIIFFYFFDFCFPVFDLSFFFDQVLSPSFPLSKFKHFLFCFFLGGNGRL